jgi:hypothetical protein
VANLISSLTIVERALYRRAVEAVIWGMPAVNYDLMYQAAVRAKAAFNQIVYWLRLPDWKNQTLTPNPDAIYLIPFIDTKDAGPIVLEIPPANGGSITGSIMDCWQRPLEDVGPAGADQGSGGKYLIMPPGYTGSVPPGYIALSSETYQVYGLLRSILKSGSETDAANALAYGKRIKMYPLSHTTEPATVFVDTVDVVFDSTIPYDRRFYRSLDRMVQYEPWLVRDKALIDQLASIGIEKGKTFNPNARSSDILTEAAREARVWIETQYEALFANRYYADAHWTLPISTQLIEGLQTSFADANAYPIDARGVTYSFAFFSPKHSGTGSFYLMTISDREGRSFDGGSAYRLTVPKNAPVTQYWSATVYDRTTHAFIRDLPWSSRSSLSPGIVTNADGSLDVSFGPTPPPGKEANWIPTSAAGAFEVLFRFYAPKKQVFDKTWKLPDIQKTE